MKNLRINSRHIGSAVLIVLLTGALVSAACRDQARASADAPVLRVGVGLGSSARESVVPILADLFYAESLLHREWDGRFTRKLATDWQWEDNGLTLKVALKPDVVLHDGTPLTADLVAKHVQRLVPGNGKAGAWGLGSVTSVAASGPHTVTLKLSAPDVFLLAALSDIKIIHPSTADIGTGPFQLVRRAPQVEAARFDRYHGGPSPIGGVRIIPFETQRAAWAALLRSEVDVVQEVSRESVEFMAGNSNIKTYSSLQPFYMAFVFNQVHPALKHVEVRRALNEAVDRDEIIDRVLRGRGRVADTPIWPYHWAYSSRPKSYEYQPDRARLRLDAAGFRQPAAKREGEARTRFSVRCLVYSEDPEHERIALLVQRQLFEVGVDMQIELVPLDAFAQRLAMGNFETFIGRLNASRTLEHTYRFWRSSPATARRALNSGYTGADELLDQLRRSTTDHDIRASVAALGRRFHDDAPAVFITWLQVTRAVTSSFAVPQSEVPDPLINISGWRLAPEDDR